MSLSIVRPDATRPNRPPAAKLSTPSSEYFGDDLDLSNWPTKNKSRGNRPVDVGQPLAGDKRRYRTEWPSIKLLCWRGSAVSPISGRWRLSRIRKRRGADACFGQRGYVTKDGPWGFQTPNSNPISFRCWRGLFSPLICWWAWRLLFPQHPRTWTPTA